MVTKWEKTTVAQFLLALVGALIPVLLAAFLLFKLIVGIQATHVDGAAGAPKAGYTGKAGVMPAKGGNAALSDAEVKAAVEHLIGMEK